ncbi:MAG: hypothetical protein ACYC7D_12250 [Nitrososphaerales archaeon]
MSSDLSRVIARRSVSLSKTYLVIGLFMALLGALISSLSRVIGNLASSGITNATGTSSLDIATALPLISIALQVFAAIIFATPILLLYVYDKNNGVLEYFLSLGMNQGDIYRQYLKAALLLASAVVVFEVVVNVVAGLITGANELTTLEVSGLVVVLALPVVSFSTLIMMSFSSLQKQRVGSNQPLGMAIGVFMVMPAYIIPLLLPTYALEVDLLLAGVIVILSALFYFSSSRLIRRERLLP